jgi:hypothetical protein
MKSRRKAAFSIVKEIKMIKNKTLKSISKLSGKTEFEVIMDLREQKEQEQWVLEHQGDANFEYKFLLRESGLLKEKFSA